MVKPFCGMKKSPSRGERVSVSSPSPRPGEPLPACRRLTLPQSPSEDVCVGVGGGVRRVL
jgi:hypothetical protein